MERKAFIVTVGALVLVSGAMLTMNRANAQQQWVMCQNPVNGEQQMFPGTRCPTGWIYIGPA